MKKRILGLLLALSLLTSFIPITAAAWGTKYGDYLYYETYSDGTVTISDCEETATEVEIPAEIEGKPVTRIDGGAFRECASLTNITIPDSVTSIDILAFEGCTSLTSVTIPDSVTSIGMSAFEGCTSLTSITIPDSVTSIGYFAFSGCTSLTSVTIPDSVTSIDIWAFEDCTSLTSVTIPNSVTSIGSGAFSGCASLTSVTIPDSVTSIDIWAFEDCTSLTSINVSSENKNYCSIDGNLFDIDKKILIRYAAGKTNTSYIIPDSVTSIGDSAFSNCTSLTSVTISDSVTTINSWAFEGCTSLTSVTIPDSVTTINSWAFEGCTSLTSINVSSENKNYCSIDGNLFDFDKKILIQYAIGKTNTSYIIPDGVTSIRDRAFEGCTSLTSVTISDSVTTINSWAFEGCTSLTSVSIPDSVTSIGDGAFYRCASLTSVTIPDGVTSIGDYASYGYTSLASVPTPPPAQSGSNMPGVFESCTSLTSVTIPDSVTSIGARAFYGCDKLTDVYYSGTEEQWQQINILSHNDCLLNATIQYNYVPPTPSTYEMGEVTPTGTGVTFTVTTKEAVSGKQAVIVACYDENGVFTGLEQREITASDEPKNISVDIDMTNAKTVKAFIWNSVGYMMPASNVQSLELQ